MTINMIRAGKLPIIHEDEIYECLACGKMYTEDAMHAHEKVCLKIPEYLARKAAAAAEDAEEKQKKKSKKKSKKKR